MTQQEIDELLDHLVNVFLRAWDGDIEDDLAPGTLNAIAGDFLSLHSAMINSPIRPTAWK